MYSQLVYGIRYLDIRVGYYPAYPEKFWVNHNFYRMRPLSEIVKDVARFVDETNEIVILDFHRHVTSTFTCKTYFKLMSYSDSLHRFPVGFTSQDRHSKLAGIYIFIK